MVTAGDCILRGRVDPTTNHRGPSVNVQMATNFPRLLLLPFPPSHQAKALPVANTTVLSSFATNIHPSTLPVAAGAVAVAVVVVVVVVAVAVAVVVVVVAGRGGGDDGDDGGVLLFLLSCMLLQKCPCLWYLVFHL